MASGLQRSSASCTLTTFPSDFDIFVLSRVTMPLCIHTWLNTGAGSSSLPTTPAAASAWAISFSWCGKMRSSPPPWMSNVSPRWRRDIAEHSICQPGRPFPQGESQTGSSAPYFSGCAAFQSAKSSAYSFSSPGSKRVPSRRSSILRWLSLP